MSNETAIRHPKRGKAHRPVTDGLVRRGFGNVDQMAGVETSACDMWISAERRGWTERVPVTQTAPEDRCKKCWPTKDGAR